MSIKTQRFYTSPRIFFTVVSIICFLLLLLILSFLLSDPNFTNFLVFFCINLFFLPYLFLVFVPYFTITKKGFWLFFRFVSWSDIESVTVDHPYNHKKPKPPNNFIIFIMNFISLIFHIIGGGVGNWQTI